MLDYVSKGMLHLKPSREEGVSNLDRIAIIILHSYGVNNRVKPMGLMDIKDENDEKRGSGSVEQLQTGQGR
jgi:hypothetical protein